MENDYTDLLNMVQQHTKCNSSYCLRKKQDYSQYCRFHFPFDHTDKTHIDFEEVKSVETIDAATTRMFRWSYW